MPVYLCGYRLPGGGDISSELGVERWGKEIERFPKTLLCLLVSDDSCFAKCTKRRTEFTFLLVLN